VVSLLGAAFISSLINLPLRRLTQAARDLRKASARAAAGKRAGRNHGGQPQLQPDGRRLQQVESDRAVILAGISHDLRTPLARMQLEVEMANLSNEAREGMQSDIGQMDAIIGQFLDYAKPTEASSFINVDLSAC
jgi:two-component system osmolarity sensor histidine kinase EnvZ